MMSGERRCAGVEGKPGMGSRCSLDADRQSHRTRGVWRQHRGRIGGQQARQMNAGANGAVVRDVLCRFGWRIGRCGGGLGSLRQGGRRSGGTHGMQMSKGQDELDGERGKRAPRSKPHMSAEPAHRSMSRFRPDQASTLSAKENSHQFEHFVMDATPAPKGKLQLTNRLHPPSFRAEFICRPRVIQEPKPSLLP